MGINWIRARSYCFYMVWGSSESFVLKLWHIFAWWTIQTWRNSFSDGREHMSCIFFYKNANMTKTIRWLKKLLHFNWHVLLISCLPIDSKPVNWECLLFTENGERSIKNQGQRFEHPWTSCLETESSQMVIDKNKIPWFI